MSQHKFITARCDFSLLSWTVCSCPRTGPAVSTQILRALGGEVGGKNLVSTAIMMASTHTQSYTHLSGRQSKFCWCSIVFCSVMSLAMLTMELPLLLLILLPLSEFFHFGHPWLPWFSLKRGAQSKIYEHYPKDSPKRIQSKCAAEKLSGQE